MNELQSFIEANDLHELKSMDDLQDNGIISDNCVYAADVADSDCVKAIEFLQANLV